jgi:hypothetical protein
MKRRMYLRTVIKTAGCMLLLGFFSSCEKDITLSADTASPKLVVEAQIENGQPPIVSLSSSLDFFTTIDTAKLNGSYVHNATLSISDGVTSYPMTEYKVPLQNGYALYYYSTTPARPLIGLQGKTYTLRIESGGLVYTSTTTIPVLTKKVDSVWWKKAPDNPDTTKAVLMARVTDPPGFGNYIRYFTKVNRDPFLPGLNSVFDDQIIDGTTYDVQINQGVTRAEKIDFKEYGYFRRGDTVVLKMCNIDKATYDFWRTWEFTYSSIGNPFSSPGKVTGNISNGALGGFSGYAVQLKTLIIPK